MLILIVIIIIIVFLLRDTTVKGIFDKFFPTRRVFETAAEVAARDVPLESHFVTTTDGYILNIFRIYQSLPAPGHVVLFQHGMMSNSADWVSVDRSIAFQLVEKGWDVWLGNNRGNIYCRDHIALPRNSKSFYSYSYHEFALYDLPAIIDYIREKTKRQKIIYVGHSQGNTQFFAMLTLLPEMNAKISAMFALAPVSSLAHSHHRNPLLYNLAVLLGSPRYFFEKLGIYGLGGYFPRSLLPIVDLTSPLWVPIGNYTIGHKLLKRNSSFACPNIISHSFEYVFLFRLRNGASWQELDHFSQSLSMKYYFNHLDYGATENMLKYGRPKPPPYDLRSIKTHVSLIWGQLDDFVTPVDLVKLLKRLRVKKVLRIPEYKHLDFIGSTKHNDLILAHISEITEQLDPPNEITAQHGPPNETLIVWGTGASSTSGSLSQQSLEPEL